MTFQSVFYIFISSFIALFPVANPIGNGFVVNGFLKDLDDQHRKAAAKTIFLNCVLIGLGSLLAGQLILLIFGLAVPVIQVGGGIIICKTGYDMLSGNEEGASVDVNAKDVKRSSFDDVEMKLFYPLSFPICIGPGSMSVIFTLMATASVKGDWINTGVNYAVLAAAIVAIVALLYLMLLQGPRITKKLGRTGNLIINKMIAFITFCIGIQIIVTGISKVFHLTIL